MPGEDLLLICYTSSAARTFSKDELLALLERSRLRNAERGITGVLLHGDGTFMQIIEGPPPAVETLFAKIARDSRHRGVMRLLQRRERERQFGDWSMACRQMSPSERKEMGAYADLLSDDSAAGENEYHELLPEWIRKLVKEFRRINR